MDGRRHLIPLGDGVYTVSAVCRILGPGMTRRRVHYWLDTGLIVGTPVARGAPGRPTLLTFEQLLQIKTVQHLRDRLGISLPRVRDAYAWILDNLFGAHAGGVHFERGPGGDVIVTRRDGGGSMTVPGKQLALDVAALNDDLEAAREAWRTRRLRLRERIVADAKVLVGAPIVRDTRIETALIASFAVGGRYDDEVVRDVLANYPQLTAEAVVEAFEFEGVERAA